MEEPNTERSREVPQSERLRQHPAERFAASQHRYDLNEVATRLGGELEAGQAGHRQETLYKRGPTTMALFLFGHLTRLPPHRTKGVVVIQVLEGHIQVTADGQAHDLHAGHLLVLAPEVEHDVLARVVSRMLLTVHLDASAANRSE
ncbi:MAG: AraC family ligand binding domain-containing protein [Phycisphaerales bacterium]|nr:AraC family ligand binding domain-containing protein [Phycisphaerales bacterium]